MALPSSFMIVDFVEDIRGTPIRQPDPEENMDNRPTYVSIRLLLESSVEFRCENDQDKARNEGKVLKRLGVKLFNPEPELTTAVQETTPPEQAAVVEYQRTGNTNDNNPDGIQTDKSA